MEFYTKVFNTKSKLYHIGYNDEGKFIREENFQPHLGIISNNNPTHKTYHNEPVEIKHFNTIKEFYTYKKSYGDMIKLFDDIEPCYQFICERYPNEINYVLNKIKVLFYDIETSPNPETGLYSPPHEADGPIVSITIKDIYNQKIYVLSTEKFYPEQMEIEVTGKVYYKFCYSEIELLKTFVKLVDKIKPDILSAYNGEGYDDAYTINRCNKMLGDYAKHLSPTRGKVESYWRQDENGVDVYKNTVEGISLVDFMLLYQKNVGKYESNTLSFVAGVELGEDKVNYEEYDNLEELRINNPQKFIEYNIIDVELLDKINKKRKLIELIIAVAYFSKSNFDDIMSPIKTWDNFIYDYLNKQNVVIPPRNQKVPEFHVPGGYVKTDVVPGIYKDVISLDLKSLYPSLAITLNISPDTLIEEDNIDVDLKKIDRKFLNKEIKHNEDVVLTASGWKYTKEKQGFYPYLFQFLLDTRDKVKKEKIALDKKIQKFVGNEDDKKKLTDKLSNLHTFEQAIKLLSNSGYGILANKHCRYFDPRLASSITLSGQLAIKTASDVVEKYLEEKHDKKQTLIFTHTDSCYINLNGVVNSNVDDIDDFCKSALDVIIKNAYTELCGYLNSYDNLLIMKREKICSHFLISAPSRYACLVVDKEGVRYKEPKLEITGMEIVRSSTPKIIKPFLKESLVKMMKDEDLSSYIEQVKKKFYKMKVEEISFPRSANNLAKWINPNGSFVSGTPIGVRAAHIYNQYIDLHGITDYNKITEGTKIKFCYLKRPNPMFNSHVIGFIRRFLGDGDLNVYVDYKIQFDKVFLDVIKKTAENVGFDIDKNKVTLEDLF